MPPAALITSEAHSSERATPTSAVLITGDKSLSHHFQQLCIAVGSRVHRDLLEFSLALHQENSEVRYRVQRRETGNRSQSHRYGSR
jgi:hypothetical protein